MTYGLRRQRFGIPTERHEEAFQITHLSRRAFDIEIRCSNRIQQSVIRKLVYNNLLKQMTQMILLPQPPSKEPDPGWVGVNTRLWCGTAEFSQFVPPARSGHRN